MSDDQDGIRAGSVHKVKMFTGKDFHLWKFQFMTYAENREVDGFLDGSEKKPEEDASVDEKKRWKKGDSTARTILLGVPHVIVAACRRGNVARTTTRTALGTRAAWAGPLGWLRRRRCRASLRRGELRPRPPLRGSRVTRMPTRSGVGFGFCCSPMAWDKGYQLPGCWSWLLVVGEPLQCR